MDFAFSTISHPRSLERSLQRRSDCLVESQLSIPSQNRVCANGRKMTNRAYDRDSVRDRLARRVESGSRRKAPSFSKFVELGRCRRWRFVSSTATRRLLKLTFNSFPLFTPDPEAQRMSATTTAVPSPTQTPSLGGDRASTGAATYYGAIALAIFIMIALSISSVSFPRIPIEDRF